VRQYLDEPIATTVTGRLVCVQALTANPVPLEHVTIELEGLGSATTGENGAFQLSANVADETVAARLTYETHVVDPATGSTTMVRVMDDAHVTRSDSHDVKGTVVPAPPEEPSRGASLDLGTVSFDEDCNLLMAAMDVAADFHTVRGRPFPGGKLEYLRETAVYGDSVYLHAYYDHVVVPTESVDKGWDYSLFHESGHVIRDILDGNEGHWTCDNVRFRYGRLHNGYEVTEEAYAFHEGWADYWDRRHSDSIPISFASFDDPALVDWVEILVSDRLTELSKCVGASAMVETLENNPRAIHSLYEFETKLCASRSCCGLEDRRPPGDCPPGYHDDGLTCRLENILAKPSYGRGDGIIPQGCSSGQEYDWGLCYPSCASGYSGSGPVCWQTCPSGYHDDGAFCRRDAVIIGADNGPCPWYDKCGLTFARGCSKCPPGYANDGCTCRIDADIFAKGSYTRGVGNIPSSCPSGYQLDAGLCYPSCHEGFTGIGPICWGKCPDGFADQGATCYRAPHVISRYPWGLWCPLDP
jgi:hypothetical protein